MRIPKPLHSWNVTPKKAVSLQRRLADRIIQDPLARRPQYVAGGDIALTPDGKRLVAAWIIWDLNRRTQLEAVHVVSELSFPYVPGLLSFREAPAMINAARKLNTEPDLFMLDGHGLAHPRRLGLASHVGLFLDRPTLGCAKSRLCGSHREPGPKRGANVRLLDDGEIVGRVVRSRVGVKPIYVSVGHRITLDEAARIALACTQGYRIPEPTRLAHHYVTALRSSV